MTVTDDQKVWVGEAATNWICLISRDTSISPSLCHAGTCTFVCTRNRWCSVIYSIKLRKDLRLRHSGDDVHDIYLDTEGHHRQHVWRSFGLSPSRRSIQSGPIQQCPYRAPDYSVRLAVSPSVAVGMVNLWECQRGYHCKWHRKKQCHYCRQIRDI